MTAKVWSILCLSPALAACSCRA